MSNFGGYPPGKNTGPNVPDSTPPSHNNSSGNREGQPQQPYPHQYPRQPQLPQYPQLQQHQQVEPPAIRQGDTHGQQPHTYPYPPSNPPQAYLCSQPSHSAPSHYYGVPIQSQLASLNTHGAAAPYPAILQTQNYPLPVPPLPHNTAYPSPHLVGGPSSIQSSTPPRILARYGPLCQYPNTTGSAPVFRATGRKRALLIGINYIDTPAMELQGCVNDVQCMHYLLSTKFGFRQSDFVIMTDVLTTTTGILPKMPTRANIIAEMENLVQGASPGDSLFFHFSGHGGQVKDVGYDEIDGKDETILPVDHATEKQIIDDELYDILVRNVPHGARLTAVLDCCHSGTGMDLPYLHDIFFSGSGTITDGKDVVSIVLATAANVIGAYNTGGVRNAFTEVLSSAANLAFRRKLEPHEANPNAGEVILFTGCMDSQLAADTNELSGSASTGAMTYCFIASIEDVAIGDWRNYTYRTLLQTMRRKLRERGLPQRPQLSTSHILNMNSNFEI